MYSRKIVILANSRKHSGSCIAGIDLKSGKWVRPINNPIRKRSDPTAFKDADFIKLCGDSFGPQLLDCYSIKFSKKIPSINQPENELIEREEWRFSQRLPLKSLEDLISPDPCEWMCDPKSISKKEMESNPVSSSLTLLHLNEADNEPMINYTEKNGYPQRRLKFTYENKHFDLSFTDYTYYILREKYSDEEMLKDFYVSVGIGELYSLTSCYHKLVVGFMPVLGDE